MVLFDVAIWVYVVWELNDTHMKLSYSRATVLPAICCARWAGIRIGLRTYISQSPLRDMIRTSLSVSLLQTTSFPSTDVPVTYRQVNNSTLSLPFPLPWHRPRFRD